MRFSIIVPNYNGERYLGECLDSLVAQRMPGLEVLVIDGGSSDRSVEIVRSHRRLTARLLSEPDRGQSDAINKGLRLATGDVVSYLNSDDMLELGALETVAKYFCSNPSADWLAGSCRVFGNGIDEWILKPGGWRSIADTVLPWDRPERYVFPQSGACFMRMSLVRELGLFVEDLHYSMDMEYYARAAFSGADMHVVSNVLAAWRWHPDAKSWTRGCAYAFRQEEVEILRRYIDRLTGHERAAAKRYLQVQERHVAVSEANYWRVQGQRWRSAVLLMKAMRSYPSIVLYRSWLGAVRRTLFV